MGSPHRNPRIHSTELQKSTPIIHTSATSRAALYCMFLHLDMLKYVVKTTYYVETQKSIKNICWLFKKMKFGISVVLYKHILTCKRWDTYNLSFLSDFFIVWVCIPTFAHLLVSTVDISNFKKKMNDQNTFFELYFMFPFSMWFLPHIFLLDMPKKLLAWLIGSLCRGCCNMDSNNYSN
jgi:hypothetical protein